jgi:hypothetical protein
MARHAPQSGCAPAHDFIGFDAPLDELPQLKWLRRLLGTAAV